MSKRAKRQELAPEAPAVERHPDGRLKRGTPNPGGQPKWVKAIRDSLESVASEGAALLGDVVAGKAVRVTLEGVDVEVLPEVANRIKAVELAFAYTLPKPTVKVEVEGMVKAELGATMAGLLEELERALPPEAFAIVLDVAARRAGFTPPGAAAPGESGMGPAP